MNTDSIIHDNYTFFNKIGRQSSFHYSFYSQNAFLCQQIKKMTRNHIVYRYRDILTTF